MDFVDVGEQTVIRYEWQCGKCLLEQEYYSSICERELYCRQCGAAITKVKGRWQYEPA